MWSFIKCVLLLSAAVQVCRCADPGLGPMDVVFHLFTPESPTISEPLLPSESSIAVSSFQRARRTIITIHNFKENSTGNFNAFVIRAHLNVEDVNVIAVDWGRVSATYSFALANTPEVGKVIAGFVNILDSSFGYNPENIRIVGVGLGAYAAGIASRHINKNVPHIIALDPSLIGWSHHPDILSKDDAGIVEVLHTTAGNIGYEYPLGDIDFYPNGGSEMVGCGNDTDCSHTYAFIYYAESLTTEIVNGNQFVATACDSFESAVNLRCQGARDIVFGGTAVRRTGSGIYSFVTNPESPFAKG